MVHPSRRALGALFTSLAMTACGIPNGPIPPTSPGSGGGPGHTLTGVVRDHTDGGPQPIATAVHYYVDDSGITRGTHGITMSDAAGRYTISGLPHGRLVKVSAAGDWLNRRFQRCVARRVMTDDATLDLDVFGPDVRNLIDCLPTISGVVYETTSGVRKPLSGILMGFCTGPCRGVVDVWMSSGTDGYYEFGGIAAGQNDIYADECNDQANVLRVHTSSTNTVFDIDLTLWIQGCPFKALPPNPSRGNFSGLAARPGR